MKILRITKTPKLTQKTNYILANSKKSDVTETLGFYKQNLRDGWLIGKRVSSYTKKSRLKTFLTKLYCTISKTRIRKKDILPITLAAIGTITPFPGAAIAGFIGGRVIVKTYSASCKVLKNYICKKS